ncbi:hypothetical protein DWB61_10375 [Ancylomarina euxinus]|uniref:Uncharacterized protein n=1 Tax=Ancylomarina euxinus TaxID=2283627 RepID=A0A425Y073_9BACT|nr:hypothetical protein [Ancylomarina euxinus]MCZ4695232.1 hypothetical protein [Ancylomarina euxinus]MUP15429.1 hypothetical protein [Ancylomarina euxinus]RRG21139.1 hypothetical protein DWB61_10375 [Ancylomarina euxinus]
MNQQTEKLELIEWLVKQSDSSVIERFQKLKGENFNSPDSEREMTPDERAFLYRIQFLEDRSSQEQDECRDFYEQYL